MIALFNAIDAVPQDLFLVACGGFLIGVGIVERVRS
jgi:hypothetical protein